jgi:hypothetical protein
LRIRELNEADNRLYQHFKAKLNSEIEKFGINRMKKEVEKLNSEIKKYYEYCVEEYVVEPKRNLVSYSNKQKFNITCILLTMKANTLTNYLRSVQSQLYPESVYIPTTEKNKITHKVQKH